MLNKKLIAASLLIISASITPLIAQTGEAEKADKAQDEKNKSGFRVSLFSKWGGKQLYVKGRKGKYEELKAFKMSYTKKHPFAKDQPVTLFTKTDGPEGEPLYLPYLSVKIPREVIEPLLILYWSPKLKKGSAQVLEFSPRRFPYGAYQVVNLGSSPVIGYIHTKNNRFLCAPKKSQINTFSIEDGAVIPIEIFTKLKDQPKIVYSSVVKHRSQRRMIFFLYPQLKASGHIQYRTQVLEDYLNE